MADIIKIIGDEEKIRQYYSLQYTNFQVLTKLFEEYLLQIEEYSWHEIVRELENVLCRCDEIDYKSDAVAIAYAIWHFLDRYHRVQIMCGFMLEKGYINRAKQYDVLDVGTGPAQVLFALSDHFQNLNKIEKEVLCTVNPDYVEQSWGFRQFLHHFVEYALDRGKQYLVPFHMGRTENAFDIKFIENMSTYRRIKYRYDITIFNNFLTTKNFTEKYSDILKQICKYTRNHGLIIIIGATEKSEKYRRIYPIIDEIVNKPFKNRFFYGYWDKVCDTEFNYKYDDEYGFLLGKYFEKIVSHLKHNNLWESVPDSAKKEFEHNLRILTRKVQSTKWNGETWKMVVYRKISKPISKMSLEQKMAPKNPVRLVDTMWKYEMEVSKNT